jgi:hypothetical protein
LIAGFAGLLVAVHLALLRLALLAALTLLLSALLTGLRLVLMFLLLTLLARRIVLVRHVILQLGFVPAQSENEVQGASFREPLEFPAFRTFFFAQLLALFRARNMPVN